jgi:hypothetical protein
MIEAGQYNKSRPNNPTLDMAQSTPEQPEPQCILERGQSTPAEGYLLGELHGELDPTGHEKASLLVFQFHLSSMQRHRRLTSVNILIHFADDQGREEFDPEVLSLAPKGIFKFHKVDQHEKRVRAIGGNVGVGIPGVIARGISWKQQQDFDRIAFITITGAARIEDRNFGKKNAVTWSIYEDGLRKEGLSLIFETAVMLKRVNNDPFRAKIQVETETAIDWTILRNIENFFRRDSGMAENVIRFSPSAPDRRILRGDPNRLREINLQELTDTQVSGGPLKGNNTQANIENGNEKGLIQIVEGLKKEQKLFDFSRGLHPEVWYKFKRFETLSLLNLYNYQDKLVILDKKISMAGGDLPGKDSAELSRLLREYRKWHVMGSCKTIKS